MAASSYNSLQLARELKNLKEDPLEGVKVKLINEDNLFQWEVVLFGPPETLFKGAYIKARMKFPADYPSSPPTLTFTTPMWHPNVYANGELCLSILHQPIDDPSSGELASERWNITQNVRTILLSVQSILDAPNISR